MKPSPRLGILRL